LIIVVVPDFLPLLPESLPYSHSVSSSRRYM